MSTTRLLKIRSRTVACGHPWAGRDPSLPFRGVGQTDVRGGLQTQHWPWNSLTRTSACRFNSGNSGKWAPPTDRNIETGRPSGLLPAHAGLLRPTSRPWVPTESSYGKYPPAKPGALGLEPLEAAGRSINERLCLPEYPPICPAISENSSGTDAFERGPRNSLRAGRRAKVHLRNQRFQRRRHTPGNVKLLLPPRQSRGTSLGR